MNDTTREMLKTIEHDTSLSQAEREALRKLRQGEIAGDPPDRVLEPADVAARFGRSKRTVHHWAECGILQPVLLPGRKRGCGFRESDVCRLIAGGAE